MNANSLLNLPRCALLGLVLWASACTVNHEAPQAGTETGNPPVIDASLISLVVSQGVLRVSGKSGAVSPGAEVEVISSLTGAVFRGDAAGDGSFEVVVDATTADKFEVRALSGGRSSSTVHVVLGGAAEGDGQKLSCAQRSELANAQMHATYQAADTSCERDEDCVLAPINTLCNDACSDAPVSTGGARDLQEARQAIETGLCKDFTRDDCSFVALPCVPPTSTTVGCRERRCQLVEPAEQTGNDCSSELDPGTGSANIRAYWYYPRAGVCVLFSYAGAGGNGNRYATLEACETACPRSGECPPNRAQTTFCVESGELGGCARSATGCALLCAEVGQACEEASGFFCSTRNICERSTLE